MKALNDFGPVLLMAFMSICPILIMLFPGKKGPDPMLTGQPISEKEWNERK